MKREATGLGGANMWLYAGLIIGCAAIFAGIILLSEKDTHFLAGLDDAVPNIRYGGDAYTGIQNAAAYTGNAVAALYKLLSTCFGLTFLFSGSWIFAYSRARYRWHKAAFAPMSQRRQGRRPAQSQPLPKRQGNDGGFIRGGNRLCCGLY